jgi:prepilin-type N-terminal cleavage/methylation domain-containing protein
MRTRQGSKGFTLYELIITLVIIAILSAMVLLLFPSNDIELDALAHQVAADIQYTQSLAVSLNARHRFDFSGTAYSIQDENGTIIKHPSTWSLDPIPLGKSANFSASGCIEFNGRGAPSDCTSGSEDTVSFQLLLNGNSRTITVTRVTGYVTVG